MSSTKVSEMTGQGFVHGVYSLVNPQIGTTRNGEPFLKCLLRDATGEAIGRKWRFDPHYDARHYINGFCWHRGGTRDVPRKVAN